MDHFELSEFDSPDKPGSGIHMRYRLLEMLDEAREIAGVEFIVNSGYRTPSHNKKVGGIKDSAHVGGWAADIHTPQKHKEKILSAIVEVGFKRIGVYPTFIHVDIDPDKPTPARW